MPREGGVPENLRPPWKPGQSGNPSGKQGKTITDVYRELLAKTEVGGIQIKDGKTIVDLVGEAVLKAILKGDMRAVALVQERTEGKVKDVVEITGKDGGAIVHEFKTELDRVFGDDTTTRQVDDSLRSDGEGRGLPEGST